MLFTPLLLVALSAAPESTWSDHNRAARVAFSQGDLGGAARHLAIMDSLVGGHAGAMSALATVEARRGRRDQAIAWLAALAGTGLVRHVAEDTTFARWRDDPAFRAVTAQLDSNGRAIGRATVFARFADAALLTEDVTWDASGRRFLVSSIHRRKVLAVDEAGSVSDFLTPEPDGVWGIYALACDAARGVLWATTAAGPEVEGYAAADSGRTALLGFDLRTRRLRERYELPRDGTPRVLGDLALADDGTVYVTASRGGGVYRLRPRATALDTLVSPGTFGSPQSPVPLPGGRRLLVADYPRGMAAVDLGSREVTWLAKPHSLAATGFDGVYLHQGRLIAIQNGPDPHRVLELALDKAARRIVSWRVLEQASEWLGEPNHGAIVGGTLTFIGNSGWERVGRAGTLETGADARPPVLLRLSLDR